MNFLCKKTEFSRTLNTLGNGHSHFREETNTRERHIKISTFCEKTNKKVKKLKNSKKK